MSTQKNVEFNKGDAALDALDIASAIPFLAQRAKYINLSKKPNMLGVLGVQLNHNLPKFSKFAGSNGLFDVASQTAEKARRGNEYQIGGNIRKEYLPDIQETVKFEKEYLNSPKFKERVIKAGYDYNDYRNKLKDSLNNLKINNINVPGKYSAFNVPGLPEIYIKNADRAGITDMKDIVAHEIGHEFDNSHMKDFINNNNVYDGGNMASRVYDKLNYFNPFAKNSNSHEADYKETVSDVHAVRKELFDASNGNYDGRYSNFNNDAYELMSEISANNPNSSSRRVFEKITNPKFKKIYEIMNKSSNEITPEEEKLIKSYGKEEVQFKKNIFNLMNRTVSNSKQYNYQDYS